MSDKPIIEINHVTYRYDRENVLEDINLQVPKGSFLGLIGPNGSGKSTLLKLILGLLKVQEGEARILGEPVDKFKGWDRVGFVSQKANSFNTGFPATVYEVVASGLTKQIGLFRFPKKKHRQMVYDTVKSVGMERFLKRNIGELSGGQQQRVFIARALVSNPDILILDEPTVGVDVKNVASFYDMLESLNQTLGITLILVTHDLEIILSKATHIAALNTNLSFYGSKEAFLEEQNAGGTMFYIEQKDGKRMQYKESPQPVGVKS